MLEESSFANRKADYFWLLFLSSLMLLVCRATRFTRSISQRTPLAGSLTTREPAIPLFAARLRPHLPVVSAPPQYTNITLRSYYDHRSILASGPCWARMDVEWHLASGGWRSHGVCGGPHWVVRQGRVDAGDDRRPNNTERRS